jgi:hypothetical protein
VACPFLPAANAIQVTTYDPGHPEQPIFPVLAGVCPQFANPTFALHPEAWSVGYIAVAIGPTKSTGVAVVDEFNRLVMDLFNLASGNMLLNGNVLNWNIWFTQPGLVDQDEWRTHAERWRESIDEDHGSPTGPGTVARYFNGTVFNPTQELVNEKMKDIIAWLVQHLGKSPEDFARLAQV